MAYQHGRTAQPIATVLTVEQVKRKNAELRRELAFLTLEGTALEAQVVTARLRVTEARRLLTRKVRELDAARAQAERIGAVTVAPSLPEPVYGGREGLLAAAQEMEEHEAWAGVTPRRKRGPSHGTEGKYGQGCRCGDCMGWRERKSERERVGQQRRRDARKRAA